MIGYPSILFLSTLPMSYTLMCSAGGALISALYSQSSKTFTLNANDLTTSHGAHRAEMMEEQKSQEILNSAKYAFMNFHHRGRTTRRRTKPMYGKYLEEDFQNYDDE